MEELTKGQQKHKDKIELLSRLIDEKAINLTEALLLLSNTEEVVKPVNPALQTAPGVRTPYVPSPFSALPYRAFDTMVYTDTNGTVSTLSQRINGGDISGKMTTDEILQDYLQKVDSQE
jgi:hypothetical protein